MTTYKERDLSACADFIEWVANISTSEEHKASSDADTATLDQIIKRARALCSEASGQ